MGRIETLTSLIPKVTSFADVGCDHGYVSEYVLKNGLASFVTISDVSKGSLKKAETLLSFYIEKGVCKSNLANGLDGISPETELVFIAGMGGMEIISILKKGFIPRKFILQPMKNSEELRRFLVENGAKIVRDFTFSDEKFYDVIVGEREGGSEYSEEEYRFGKENLEKRGADFIRFLIEKNRLDQDILKGELPDEVRREIEQRIKRREELL